MDGRLEHELKMNEKIAKKLSELPEPVNKFYNNIKISKSPRTCYEYIRYISNLIDYSGKENVLEIDDYDIQEYLNSIQYVNKKGTVKKASSSYTKLACSAFNQFFKFLYRHRMINGNPMDLIDRPMRKDSVKRVFLSMDELNSILEAVKYDTEQPIWKSRDYAIMYLFMVTGMRKTALSEINMNNIDWKEERLIVIDKRDKEQIYIITPQMKKVLKSWISYRNEYLKKSGVQEDALFISNFKKRMDPQSVYNVVRKYSQQALGRAISPHKLRAAFVSLYYAETKDIDATKEAVGHSNINTTSIYIVRSDEPRRQSAAYMSNNLKI